MFFKENKRRKYEHKKKAIGLALAAGFVLAGCSSQISNEKADTEVSKEAVDVKEVASENAKKDISEEPRFNDTIKLGYSGDLCLGAPNIAELNGYFASRDIGVEFIKGDL